VIIRRRDAIVDKGPQLALSGLAGHFTESLVWKDTSVEAEPFNSFWPPQLFEHFSAKHY